MTTPPAPPPAAQTRETLLCCPFCGKVPEPRWHGASGEDDDSGYWGIDCCHAFAHEGLKEDAIAAWNKRATPAERAIDPVVMAAAKELEGLLASPAERPGDATAEGEHG